MEKEKDIYKLNLHETVRVGKSTVMRVPGGWIYSYSKETNAYGTGVALSTRAVFVPFNNEFQP